MSKTTNLFKKISKDPALIINFQNSESFEEIHDLCKQIEPDITSKEVKNGIKDLISKSNQKETQEVNDKEMEMIAGGRMDFNKFKASAVTALIVLGGMTTTAALTQISARANSSAVSTNVNENAEIKKDPEFLKKEFFEAVKNNNIPNINRYLAEGVDVNAKDKDGKTALMQVASRATINKTELDIIELLIYKKADINIQNNQGQTPIMILSNSNYKIEALKLLINKGANINSKDNNGNTILFYALKNTEILKLLLEKGTDANIKNNQGQTPLISAALKNRLEAAQLLINFGADINAKDDYGISALKIAVVEDEKELKEILKIRPVSMMDEENISRVSREVAIEREKITRLLLARGALKDDENHVLFVQAAKKGSLNLIKLFIRFDVNIETKDHEGKTALISAAEKGYTEVVKWLIGSGANINATDNEGKTALMRSMSPDLNRHISHYENFYKNKEEIAGILIENGANLNIKDTNEESALMHALKNHNVKTTAMLIKKGADVNTKNTQGITPLMYAATNSSINRNNIKMLLEKGAKINEKSNNGETALICATKSKNTEIIKLLVEKGADVSLSDENNRNILFHILFSLPSDHYDIEKALLNTVLETGVDINTKDVFGNTALMVAAYQGDIHCAKILLEKGTDVNAKNNEGYTALMLAKNKEVTELLLEKGADIDAVNNEGQSAFMLGAYREKPATGDIIKEHLYIPNKGIDVIKTLIEKGANVNVKDKQGESAIALANRADIFNLLKENKSIPEEEKKPATNSWLLLDAVENNKLDAIKNLLEENYIDINKKDSRGKTALTIAVEKTNSQPTVAYKNYIEVVKLLLEKGADAKSFSLAGIGKKELIELLLANGADINGKNSEGITALMYKKDPKIVKFLIENGADINAKDKNGKTALMYLSSENKSKETFESLKILIENGADVHMKDNEGRTALIYALNTHYTEYEPIEFLVKSGADVNTVDNKGATALMYAAVGRNRGQLKSVKLLLEKGADFKQKDRDGKTALSYARSGQHQGDTIKFLESIFKGNDMLIAD